VLESRDGRSVRADYRCISSAEDQRYVWEQELEGSPFERVLRSSVVEVGLEQAGDGTEVSLTNRQTLRGLSRLGSPMMRRGTARILEQALDGIERALAGDSDGRER
jgi:carbon monoxide dehydrogenase subunit G